MYEHKGGMKLADSEENQLVSEKQRKCDLDAR